MKILIIGYSDLARRKIIPAIKKIRKLKFEIASISKKEQNIGQDNWYRNYDIALKKSNAEIVYISIINSKHFTYALKALKKNKNVIVDKPITLKHSQTLKLLEIAKKKKLLISQALVFTYHRHVKVLKKIIEKNRLKVNNIIMQFYIPKPTKGNFKLYNKMGGGCINDMIYYAAEVIRLFVGTNIKYQKMIIKKSKKINEHFTVTSISEKIHFSGFYSHNSEYKNDIIFSSNKGIIKLNRFSAPPTNLDIQVKVKLKNKIQNISIKKDDTFKNYLLEYIKILRKKNYLFYHQRLFQDSKIIEKLKQNKIII